MDHYIPKRRVPVTLWSNDLHGSEGQIFLDLDPEGSEHQTLISKLNESSRFVPAAVGPEGRIQLFNKARLSRVTAGRQVLQSDVFTRGFTPWREEDAEVRLADGTVLHGRVWMPLERPTQRISDFMNQHGWDFFILLMPGAVQLINSSMVVKMTLSESAGAPLGWGGGGVAEALHASQASQASHVTHAGGA